MPVIIEEVTAEAIKPVGSARSSQPPTEIPADSSSEARKLLAELRRAEARAQRLRAD